MAIDAMTYGFTIVVSNSVSYHTYTDWGLITQEGDPIGDPEQETNYLSVMGRQDLLDATESLVDEPVFKGRTLTMNMALMGEPSSWVTTVSVIRNAIEGRQVKIYFDDDPSHFWKGRIRLTNTSRVKRLGRFTMTAYVDAHKWNKASSQEQLRWDDMNFLTDRLDYLGTVQITDSGSITVLAGDYAVVPTIKITNKTSDSFTMTVGGTMYNLTNGTYRYPAIKVCGSSDVTFAFVGTAKVTITYRGGSL